QFPSIVGMAGVGEKKNGQLVIFRGIEAPYGAMAEKVCVPEHQLMPVPEGIDSSTASAVLSAAFTSLFPLKNNKHIKNGGTVLINGATGVSGKLAIQIAAFLGAKRIIGTGRNEQVMNQLKDLGV